MVVDGAVCTGPGSRLRERARLDDSLVVKLASDSWQYRAETGCRTGLCEVVMYAGLGWRVLERLRRGSDVPRVDNGGNERLNRSVDDLGRGWQTTTRGSAYVVSEVRVLERERRASAIVSIDKRFRVRYESS